MKKCIKFFNFQFSVMLLIKIMGWSCLSLEKYCLVGQYYGVGQSSTQGSGTYSKTSKMTDFWTIQKNTIFIFKLLLDSYRKNFILQGLRWPLNVICEEWELNANRHFPRSVTCKAVIYEVLLYHHHSVRFSIAIISN